MLKERVHIVPFGYEYDRVLRPINEGKVDSVVFLYHEEKERDSVGLRGPSRGELHEKAKREMSVDEEDIIEKNCDMYDIYDSMKVILKIISRHEGEEVYVNLATGTKLTAVAGMIACMSTEAEPFYVKAGKAGSAVPPELDDPEKLPERKKLDRMDLDEVIVSLPEYPIEGHSDDEIEVMKYIRDATNEEKGTYVTKKKIIEAAKERNLKFAIEGDIENDKSLYPRLDSNILEPLLNKDLVEVESVGRSSRVTLTDTGRETVDAFEHLV
jgi:hypothetical protein